LPIRPIVCAIVAVFGTVEYVDRGTTCCCHGMSHDDVVYSIVVAIFFSTMAYSGLPTSEFFGYVSTVPTSTVIVGVLEYCTAQYITYSTSRHRSVRRVHTCTVLVAISYCTRSTVYVLQIDKVTWLVVSIS
jgi:hypothetical protein